jgi:dTDP-4-amino-4,6-dideoxygalactose transaminase
MDLESRPPESGVKGVIAVSRPTEPISVPALDLKAQYDSLRGEIEPVVREVLESQYFILGPEVSGFEAEVAGYCGVGHGVGCASGSDALLLPLMALGVGPGDEVITSPYTFFATGGAIWRTGAKPVFVDIEPDTYNIDPSLIEAALTPRTKVIIPVHLYGQTADMDPINEIAGHYGLSVLEDAAQAIGAAYKGQRTGGLGHAAAFSFYPSKNLGGFGDAGLVSTDDPALARSVGRLRVHGMEPKYHHHEVGINSRLDALQAAVLRVKLRHLDAWTEARREAARRYQTLFEETGLAGDRVVMPGERPGYFHVYNQFVVRVPAASRDALRAHLAARRVGTEIYYPIPLHLQVCFASLGHRPGDFPASEAAAAETIALPMYPELGENSQRYVVETIAEFLNEQADSRVGDGRAA